MFKNILLMVDNSPEMEEAINYLINLFPNSFYYLLSTINLQAFSGYYSKIVYKEMHEMSTKSIRALEDILKQKDIKYTSLIKTGEPASIVESVVKTEEINLFVMITHAGIEFDKIKIGTTTASVIINLHIPVMLLPKNLEIKKNPIILHPTTGTKYSDLATTLACQVAKSLKGSLKTLILCIEDEGGKIKEKVEKIVGSNIKNEFYFIKKSGFDDQLNSILHYSKESDLIIGSRGSPGPYYKLRFFFPSLALDPLVKTIVAFLPKPLILLCD